MTKEAIVAAIDAQAKECPRDLGLVRRALGDLPSERGFATVVTGIRRCGKSTLLRQWTAASRKRSLTVLFDDLRLLDFTADDFALLGKVIDERRPSAVVLDEVQDVAGWERFVAGLLLRPNLSVFVTGSNAKMLSRELGTKLTGRHFDFRLTPFDYPEFLAYTKCKGSARSLDAYLATGGFPAFVRTRNRQVLSDLFDDILFRDVVVRYGISNTASVRQLAAFLLTHVGTRFAPSRLKDAIHVQSAKTVLEYVDHLIECCLVDRLEKFAESPKARLLAPKKIYACDTGLMQVFESGASANLGHKLENAVFSHLKRRGGDLSYFIDGRGRECDFIRRDAGGATEAVQVCWELTDDNVRREFDGLLSALERFGLKRGTLVTRAQNDEAVFGGREIRVVSASDYLTS